MIKLNVWKLTDDQNSLEVGKLWNTSQHNKGLYSYRVKYRTHR